MKVSVILNPAVEIIMLKKKKKKKKNVDSFCFFPEFNKKMAILPFGFLPIMNKLFSATWRCSTSN